MPKFMADFRDGLPRVLPGFLIGRGQPLLDDGPFQL